MLHDLFLALVGLCGDLIVEGEDRFFVRPGLTILSVGEIEQLDNIAPLGWFYKKLLSFVHLYEVQWSPSGNKNNRFEAYIASMSAGVSTVLSDYENDVTTLEQLVAIEPIPLCQVYQHMQKVPSLAILLQYSSTFNFPISFYVISFSVFDDTT